MIELRRGDILAADAEAFVNTVNCVGVMGRGIALQFRRAFPENYEAYAAACKRGDLQLGRIFVYPTKRLCNPRFILNFPTKQHWRGASRLGYIEAGLSSLVEEVKRRGIHSIAVPPLGCGLGGLDWSDVRPRIERAFAEVPEVRVLLYEPIGAPAPAAMARSGDPPRMTSGRAVLIGLMGRYLAGLMDPFVSLLEVHKLLYFAQEAGENLKLRYRKAPYGPYAENLRHALIEIEGYFVTGYGDGADRPDVRLELLPHAGEQAAEYLAGQESTRERFDRVARLIEGFESPFGLELLATVHWVATREGADTPEAAIRAAYAWAPRKRMFSEHHLCVAWRALEKNGWLEADHGVYADSRRPTR